MKITLLGRVPSKKNSRTNINIGGRLISIPSKKYKEWHTSASMQLIAQAIRRISGRVSVDLVLYPPDRIKGDLTNKAESVMDLLVDNKIIEDDNWFNVWSVNLRFGGVDRKNPRVEIEIT